MKALRTKVYSCRSQLQTRDVIRWRQAAEWDGAHVFHESIVATRNLLTSIPYTSFLRKTRSPFPCDVRYTRYYDSSMDLVAKAIYEDPVVIGFLLGWLSLPDLHECGSETNVSLHPRSSGVVQRPFEPPLASARLFSSAHPRYRSFPSVSLDIFLKMALSPGTYL